jgi:hypothetical protein
MRKIVVLFLLLALSGANAAAKPHKLSKNRTNPEIIHYILSIQEKTVLDAAEAMPEEKYNFAPTAGEFRGVRTFAEQVRHIAADNWLLGAGILGEQSPVELGGGEAGNLKAQSKAELIADLKASFAYMHRAAAASDDGNVPIRTPGISLWPQGTATRLGVAIEDMVHTWDHYGQMVEYLRMNGIVPPESRPKQDAGGGK